MIAASRERNAGAFYAGCGFQEARRATYRNTLFVCFEVLLG